eukprot:3289970-Pyramimonas_sp.AAC.1
MGLYKWASTNGHLPMGIYQWARTMRSLPRRRGGMAICCTFVGARNPIRSSTTCERRHWLRQN